MVEFTPEQETIRHTVNRICREKLAPRAAEMDRTGEFPWDILREFAQAGLTSMFFPVEYGGLGKDLITSTMVMALDKARLDAAAMGVGLAQGALDYAVEYAKSRVQFKQPVAEFQGMQFLFADMATRLAAARALTYEAARRMEARDSSTSHFCAMAKLFASDMAMQVTVDAVQALGGYGVVRDHPVERMMRDAKILQIFDGTNQIQRLIIARGLLR